MLPMLMWMQKKQITISKNNDFTLKPFPNDCNRKNSHFLMNARQPTFKNSNAKCMQPLITFNLNK